MMKSQSGSNGWRKLLSWNFGWESRLHQPGLARGICGSENQLAISYRPIFMLLFMLFTRSHHPTSNFRIKISTKQTTTEIYLQLQCQETEQLIFCWAFLTMRHNPGPFDKGK